MIIDELGIKPPFTIVDILKYANHRGISYGKAVVELREYDKPFPLKNDIAIFKSYNYEAKKLPLKECKYCKCLFEPRRNNQQYHSEDCRIQHNLKRIKEESKKVCCS
jgi:hypothetical protein